MALVEVQVLNRVIATKDFSIITVNNIGLEHFPNFAEEFTFIQNHYNTYHNVPDPETVAQHFVNFEFVNVTEPNEYLVKELNNQLIFNRAKKLLQDSAEMLVQQDSEVAVSYLMSNMEALTASIGIQATDLVADADIRLQEYIRKTKSEDSFISTGFEELDDIIGGFDRQEEYALICARTNMGKSWWLLYFAFQAIKQGYTVGLYSGEMTSNKVGYRLDTLDSHISNFCLTHGEQSVFESYVAHIKNIKNSIPGKLWVITPKDLGGFVTVPKLMSFCRKYKIQMLCIDQYSLVQDVGVGNKQHFEKSANISRDIKNMQTQLQIPILMACQLNREKNEGGPDTTNIAGSDRAGQDATSIYFLERTQNGSSIKVTVGKHRDAPVGSVLNYNWNIDKGIFTYVPVEGDATGEQVANSEQEYRESYGDKSDSVF